MATNNPPKRLIALDFDGVLIDSVGESSLSALEAARRLWGDTIIPLDADLERAGKRSPLLKDMAYVRPCVETGYENIVQIRLLLEGMDADYLLRNWRGEVLPQAMERWGLDRAALVKLFGRVRDEWIARDLEGWLAPNATYGEEVGQAVRACLQRGDEVFVVTTKQAQFTAALLKGLAGLPELAGEEEETSASSNKPPGEGGYARIISTTLSGRPKVAVLEELRAKHAGEGTRCVFVEDKLSTLETTEKRFAQKGQKNPWEILLVDWGYNTQEERERARELGINVVGREGFSRALEGV
jgi:phosphoglycolate phosphatase-like HAD superfamily hydrolase